MKEEIARRWMWCLLILLVSLQAYFVQELLAALIIFAALFGAVVGAAALVYLGRQASTRVMHILENMLRTGWRVSRSAQPSRQLSRN